MRTFSVICDNSAVCHLSLEYLYSKIRKRCCHVQEISAVGNFLFRDTSQNIIDRNFKGQSNIGTMFKDLGIARSMAKDCGVPLFTTSVAYELFQAGKATNPEEDNWTIIKILENIVGVTVGDDES